MTIDISICDLQLLDLSLPLIFNFCAGFNALSMYDEVSISVKFYYVDIYFVCLPSFQPLNVTKRF